MTTTTTKPEYTHYDFRGGRWWVCLQGEKCDGKHHVYVPCKPL